MAGRRVADALRAEASVTLIDAKPFMVIPMADPRRFLAPQTPAERFLRKRAECILLGTRVQSATPRIEKDRGNLQKQTPLFQQLVRLQPDNLKALLLLAQSLQQESKDAETIVVLRHILQLKPDSENALYMLSMEVRKTNPEEAKTLQQEFAAQKRKEGDLAQVKSLGNEAYQAANKQDWPEAIRLLKKALESCQQCEVAPALHKNLGLALCSDGNLDEGKQELQEALKLNPNDADIVKALKVVAQRQ